RMQNRMTGAVGGSASALGGAFAVIRGHAAEWTLIDFAFGRAREWHAVMLELDYRLHGVLAHIFDGVLIAEPVAAIDGVVKMPAPVVRTHMAGGGENAALRGYRVRARGKYFGDAGGVESCRSHADRGAQSRTAGTDDDDIVIMVDDIICGHVSGAISI